MAAILRTFRRRLGALTIGPSLVLIAVGVAIGAPGDLDPTFGQGGRVFINIDSNAEAASSLVQQSDGKLLLGRATNFEVATSVDLSVVRLNPDGTRDMGFGGDGMASTNLPGITASTKVVVQQGSGDIVVAGPAWNDGKQDPHFFALARYRPDGTLDATFGSGGFVLEDYKAASASIAALVVLPDGRLVAAGEAVEPGGAVAASGGRDMAFARFNANGSIDSTFGLSGRLIVDFESAGRADGAHALMRRSDGRLIAAGMAEDATLIQHPVLLALTADGVVDASFGMGGRAIPNIAGEQMRDGPQLGLQSDGKIVLAGVVTRNAWASCELLVTRLDVTGHLDPTFGKAGFATLPLGNCWVPVEVKVALDDHILIGRALGYYDPWEDWVYCPCTPVVMRLASNGAFDDTFGVSGMASVDLGRGDTPSSVDPNFSFGTHLVQQADGRIVVAATGEYGNERYLLNGAYRSELGIAVARLVESGASAGTIGFTGFGAAASESRPSVDLYVQRTGGAAGTVSLQYATSDMSAYSVWDYTRTSGTLTWVDGDTADKTISIPITDDSMLEGMESLEVTLSNPTGGAFLAWSRSGVTIADNDPASVPVAPPVPSPGSTTSGGGGSVGWVQILALSIAVVAIRRRRVRPGNLLPSGRMIGLSLLLVAAGAVAAPGDLDPTFGTGGRVFINMDANAEAAASLLQQSDGKLLIGRATNLGVATSVDLSAMRLNPTGTVDASFGGDGVASVDLPGITASTKVMGQQGFGSVVVAGRAWRDDDPNRGFFAIARYLSDGTLDSSFGSSGYILDDFGAPRATINALVVQPDGKLVVAGNVETTPGVTNAAFSRFNANGSLDPTFGQNGRLILDVAGVGRADSAYALVRRFDGRLIATVTAADANWSTDEWWHVHTILLSLTADGNVDSSFGPDGRVSLDIDALQAWGTFPQAGFQSDGKVVVAWLRSRIRGGLDCDLHLSRLDGSGHLDPTFGTSGFERVALGRCYVQPRLVVSPDDSILFSAPPYFDSPWDYTGYTCPCAPLVMRMTANGAPDTAFGVNGAASVDLGIDNILSNANTEFGTHLIQQTDGNIAIASTGVYDKEHSTLNGAAVAHSGIAVARLLNSGASSGLIGFQAEVLPIPPESQASVRLVVQRTGGSAGAVSVQFATSNGSAVSGSDYVPTSGTLTWLDGDVSDKLISIGIVDDPDLEDYEWLGVTLFSPTGGAFLATSRSTVFIQSSDPDVRPQVVPVLPTGSPTNGAATRGGGAVDWALIFLLMILNGFRHRFERYRRACPRTSGKQSGAPIRPA